MCRCARSALLGTCARPSPGVPVVVIVPTCTPLQLAISCMVTSWGGLQACTIYSTLGELGTAAGATLKVKVGVIHYGEVPWRWLCGCVTV